MERPLSRSECLRGRPIPWEFAEPPRIVADVERPVLVEGLIEVVTDHACDHVDDVVPVVAEAGEPLDGLPGFGRVVG
jgi:hypothetical protein